eukprot:GHVS01028921.1.p1 GENE.GHVS01028921.1~~GHVS01028921.1.p1  ORF type:complete len:800 (-),score=171.75 GHVS01028921.1:229-2628(-)
MNPYHTASRIIHPTVPHPPPHIPLDPLSSSSPRSDTNLVPPRLPLGNSGDQSIDPSAHQQTDDNTPQHIPTPDPSCSCSTASPSSFVLSPASYFGPSLPSLSSPSPSTASSADAKTPDISSPLSSSHLPPPSSHNYSCTSTSADYQQQQHVSDTSPPNVVFVSSGDGRSRPTTTQQQHKQSDILPQSYEPLGPMRSLSTTGLSTTTRIIPQKRSTSPLHSHPSNNNNNASLRLYNGYSSSTAWTLNIHLLWKMLLVVLVVVLITEWWLVGHFEQSPSKYLPSVDQLPVQKIQNVKNDLKHTDEAQTETPITKAAIEEQEEQKEQFVPNDEHRSVELVGEKNEDLQDNRVNESKGEIHQQQQQQPKAEVVPVSDSAAIPSDELNVLESSTPLHERSVVGKKVVFIPPSKSLQGMMVPLDTDEFMSLRDQVEEVFPFDSPIPVINTKTNEEHIFTFVDVLGGGGQGTVIFAHAQSADKQTESQNVAVKIFSKKTKGDDRDAKSFEVRELLESGINALVPEGMDRAEFSESKQIVLPLGVYVPKTPFEVPPDSPMRYSSRWMVFPVFAGDLTRLAIPWKATPPVKKELMHQMCLAILNLHDGGLVHADVKMQNFFAKMDGRIFVGDFSLSRVAGADVAPYEGTLRLLPPEHMIAKLAKERIIVTEKKDVWSLGIVFYRMWCDKRYPYGIKLKGSRDAVTSTIAKAKDSSLSFHNCEGATEFVKDLMRLMLHTDPALRPSLRQLYEHHKFFTTDFESDLIVSDSDEDIDVGEKQEDEDNVVLPGEVVEGKKHLRSKPNMDKRL